MTKNIKIVFAISILVNIFLLGFIVGDVSKMLRFESHKGFCYKKFEDKFSPSSKALFQEKIKNFRGSENDFRKQVKKAREDVLAVLAAENFDKQLYREKLDILRGLHRSRMDAFATIIEDLASQMPQKDRITLAQALEKFAYQGHHRRKHKA